MTPGADLGSEVGAPTTPAATWPVVRLLGRGGTGVVELVRSPTGEVVARKRVAVHGSADAIATAVRRLRREAEVLATLEHPAIMRLLSVEEGPDRHDVVLTMPHLGGGSLADLVARHGPMPPELVEELAERLLPALAAAHAAGVVHRDLSPANILFGAASDVSTAVLADFSIASTRDFTAGLTGTGRVIGTPMFMAPEQARGDGTGTAADVFSLGACLFFAATGRSPLAPPPPAPSDVEPAAALLRAAGGQVAPVPEHLPPGLRSLLEGLLAVDPADRAAASMPGGALRSMRTFESTVVMPAAVPPRSRRRLWRVVLPSVIGASVSAGVAGFAVSRSSDEPTTAVVSVPSTLGAAPACPVVPYRNGCGGPVASGALADGSACKPDREDLDGNRANGCEAAADAHRDGEALATGSVVQGTLVPAGDVDTYTISIEDGLDLFCDGKVTARLTAPAGASYRLRILRGSTLLAEATSSDSVQAVATVTEPSCFGDDSGPATLEVRAVVPAARTAGQYRLSWTGSF